MIKKQMPSQATLWIGPEKLLIEKAVTFIQTLFCNQGACGSCVPCRAIIERQFHALTWLVPENFYTVKQLEPLMKAVTFTLDEDRHHVLVIERADLLNSASANSLLKALEEPPPRYHYLLLAPRLEGILPTIRSRCVVETFLSGAPNNHKLMTYFVEANPLQGAELLKEIEKERVLERDIDQLLDACMHAWHEQQKKAFKEGEHSKAERFTKALAVAEQAREKIPMPGSSKLFLKNLFLRLTLAFQ